MPPKIVSLADEANTQARYENHPVADVNDQGVRISDDGALSLASSSELG